MSPPDSERARPDAANVEGATENIKENTSENTEKALEIQGGGFQPLHDHVEMLHRLGAGCPGWMIATSFGQDPATGEEIKPVDIPFEVGDIDGMVAAFERLSAEQFRNIYMAPVVFRSPKRLKSEVSAVLAFVADFDDDDAPKWADRCPVTPDYVLETSAERFQAFFILDRPITIEEAEPLAKRLVQDTGCDSCSGTISQVFRVPGGHNWPSKRKVGRGRSPEPQLVKVVKAWDGSRTLVADLDDALPALPVVEAVVKEPRATATYFDAGSFVLGLPATLQNKIRAKPGPKTDRSADIFGVVQALMKKNLTDDQIAEVIEDHPDGIGHKYRDRDDLEKDIARIRTKPPTSPDLRLGNQGQPLANLINARILLKRRDWVSVLKFNEFANRIEVHRPGPVNFSAVADIVDGVVVWNDACDTLTAEWMQGQGVGVKTNLVAEAVEVTARETSYHPVREYLDGLNWDGRPRLDTWTRDFLGAPDDRYNRAVAAAWMIGAVARIQDPGCKMDTALILEGSQGLGKSTALKVLAGDWFTDELGDIKNKDTLQTLHSGVWIIEMGELDCLSKSEVNSFKQFMSAQCDFFRPPYGRRSRNHRRSCLFAGSTNETEYFRDVTGNRRFWPVACTKADVVGLKAVRDQLWAEAADRYRNGERWHLSKEVEKLAQAEQRSRLQSDPWEAKVMAWAEQRSSVTIEDALRVPLGLNEVKDWGNRANAMRVGKILRSNGWRHRGGGERPRPYEPPDRPANLAEVGSEVGRKKAF